MRDHEFISQTHVVKVNGDPALLSRNTIPGVWPWRVTWFDREDHESNEHVDINAGGGIVKNHQQLVKNFR